MTANAFSSAMCEISEKYITEAISYQPKSRARRIDWKSWRTIAACILITVFLGFSSVMAFSAEARAAVFGWVREVYETYVSYHFVGEEPAAPETVVYKAAWIPEGYQVLWEPIPGPMVVAGYRNDAGEVLSISYSTGGTFHVGDEGVTIEDAYVGEIPAKFYADSEEGDTNFLIWIDEETGLHFSVSAPLPKEDLIRIAESLELVRFEPLTLENAVFRPTWLPEGYTVERKPEPGKHVSSVYVNNAGVRMAIQYAKNSESHILEVQTGDRITVQKVSVDGFSADLYLDMEAGASNILIWENTDVGAIFTISATLSGEDMIKIAESLELVRFEQ